MSGHINQQSTLAATPKLYIWSGEMLFLGTFNVPHRAHRVVQEKLIVCLEGTLSLHCPGGECIVARSCLLQTGVYLDTTEVDVGQAVVAVFYLALLSRLPRTGKRYAACLCWRVLRPSIGRVIN